MEQQYLAIYKSLPMHAQDMLQAFSDKTLLDALKVVDRLQEELFTRLTSDIQAEYKFAGA